MRQGGAVVPWLRAQLLLSKSLLAVACPPPHFGASLRTKMAAAADFGPERAGVGVPLLVRCTLLAYHTEDGIPCVRGKERAA